MTSGVRRLTVCVACCLAGVVVWAVWPSGGAPVKGAQSASASNGSQSKRPLALGSFVVPSMQELDGDQQAFDAERARHASVGAFFARQRSRTEFAHLGTAAAERVAREAFPDVVDHPAGGPPPLPAGAHIVRYITPSAAQIALSDGRHAVVESDGVMASKVAPGRFVPLDLSLRHSQAGYAPAFSDVGIRIPEHSASGVALAESGVSLAPTDAHGVPLSGSPGIEDGAVVLYANTETDTDTLAKPTGQGFDLDAVLRSEASPRTLYFRVGMPEGARVQKVPSGNLVHVLRGQATIASIVTPYAQDAAGTDVPVSMNLAGDLLSVSVGDRSGEYQYPVAVDPSIIDEQVTDAKRPTNWRFETDPADGSKFTSSGWTGESGLTVDATGSYAEKEAGMLIYPIREGSEAWIESFSVRTTANLTGTNAVATIQLENNKKEVEHSEAGLAEETFGSNLSRTDIGVAGACRDGKSECPSTERGSAGNAARYALRATGSGSGASAVTEGADVDIDQEKGAELSFDTTHEYVDGGQRNILYGGGSWLGPNSGAFEIHAKDPGIGISSFGIAGGDWSERSAILEDGECVGVQCNPEFNKGFSYNSKMPNGEDDFEATACDAAEQPSECALVWPEVIKVDGTLPYGVKLTGLPSNNELGDDVKYTLKAEASDKFSGIKSIELLMDGREFGKPSGSCTTKECTAKAEWTVGFESYGAGPHTLTVLATSNAGDVETTSYAVTVRHAAPVALGPGSVQPVMGEFSLASSDVAVGAPPAALTVSRHYGSRRLTAGASGPFGPQWSTSLGGEESLTTTSSGNVELVGSGGQPAAFTRNSKGELESPKGDGNLTLEGREAEKGKGISEYWLKDSAQGTTTKFAQPSRWGLETIAPTYSSAFGSEGKGTGQFKGPGGVAVDAHGNLWVLDHGNDRIDEFNEKGEYLKNVGTEGPGDSELSGPDGIAVDSKGNIWVADTGNDRVVEFNEKGEFTAGFGYGVSNGEAKFEVCTSGCEKGIAGSGNGQFDLPEGIAVDAHGNVWVSDTYNGRVEEFNEKHEFVKVVGSKGSGADQIGEPKGLAIDPHGNVWVADWSNSRVEEFNEKGEFVDTFGYGVSNGEAKFEVCASSCKAGIAGAGNGEFKDPYGLTVDSSGDVWVGDTGNERVEIFNEKAEYLNQFGSSGSGVGQFNFTYPMGMARVGNGIWVTDKNNTRLEKWTLPEQSPTWVPKVAEGPASASTITYSYKTIDVAGKPTIVPSEELGAKPAGVTSCPEEGPKGEAPKAEKGCRELTFRYAEKSGTLGENEKEWGEYEGRLMKVSFTAYNPAKGVEKIETKVVAEYAYDKQGRLRAEWNPQVAASADCGKTCQVLKTIYGYDSEGHVTALTPPGQESWAFTYGAISGESNTGRVLKATLAPVSAKLWKGEAPKNTEAEPPKLSGTAVVGVKMGVSNGTWSNEPVAYGYQWEDCNTEGKECTPILGATNANYTVASSDVGHKLVAEVEATNGGGSVTASTAASSVVSSSGTKTEGTQYAPQPGSTVEYRVPLTGGTDLANMTEGEVAKWGQKDDPVEAAATAIFPPDEPEGWPTGDYRRGTVYYEDDEDRLVNVASPGGGIATTEYNATNDVERSLTPDNRTAALKEGCKSVEKKECKSAEEAELLETKTEYNGEGNEVLKTTGPQHLIRLAGGSEVQGRDITHDYYGNGSTKETEENKEAEEKKKKETYHLETKSTNATLVSGKEEEVRTVTTSYSGQNDLGWKLRKPTSVTTEPAGLDLVHKTVYEEGTGNVVEAQSPGAATEAAAEEASELKSFSSFGGSGSGGGQLERPGGVATDSSGDVWVADTGHGRVQEFNSKGEFVHEFNATARAIAVSAAGDVYVAGSNKVEVYNPKGEFVRKFEGSGEDQFQGLAGVAVDGEGHVWTIDEEGVGRVKEFTAEGVFMKQFGNKGKENGELSRPEGIAVDSKGDVWVADTGNERIEEFKSSGEFVRVFGSEGTGNGQFEGPGGLAVDSEGDIWVADTGNNRVQRFNSEGSYLSQVGTAGNENGQFDSPEGIAIGSSGDVWVADTGNNRIQELTGSEFVRKFGGSGSGGGQLSGPSGVATDSSGDVWVADTGHERVQEFNSKGEFVREFGAAGEGNGEFYDPRGIAVSAAGDVYVADVGNERVQEFNSKGEFVRKFGSQGTGEGQFQRLVGVAVDGEGHVWTLGEGYGKKEPPRVEEFTPEGVFMKQFGVYGKENGELIEPEGIAVDSKGDVWVADTGNERVEEFKSSGEFVRVFGAEGTGNGQFKTPVGLAFDSEGDLWVADSGNDRVQRFTDEGSYLSQVGKGGNENGQFEDPEGIATSTSGSVWVADTNNNRIDTWTPEHRFAHDTQTIYYSAYAYTAHANCGEHPEWAGLACQTEPVAQPDHGLPELAVSTITAYNIWDEPEATQEKFGTGSKAITRTKIATYDPAGREMSGEVTSSPANGTALPKVTNEYNTETGALEKQSSTTESKTKTITSVLNTHGELTSYTDADEATTTYEYEGEGSYKGEKELDGRLRHVNDGKGTETYKYGETTGLPEELTNEYGTTKLVFTATYDVEGKLLTEGYPNAMTASHIYDATGAPVSLEYSKTAHCNEKCPETWFKDAVTRSAQGQTMSQVSSLATDYYSYDGAGRLIKTQETPAGKSCTTRMYAYEEETNRTSLKTYEPGTEGKCATEKGTEEKHTYDEGNRLTDAGVEYEAFGNTTKLPASDAGGKESSENLTSTYYVDNQLATQTQNGQTIGYYLDPDHRTIEIINTGKKASTVIEHYAGPGETPVWSTNTSGEVIRDIHGIDGDLVATQTNSETPVLQLSNLHGDIIATASASETVTKLESKANTTEFGVPTTSLPSKYSWLGAIELSTELPSGVVAMGARSYVPELGRFLQPDPRPGGSANAYSYTFGDPLDQVDPTGEWTFGTPQWLQESDAEWGVREAAVEAARLAAERREAERMAREAAEREAYYAAIRAETAAGEAARESWGSGEEGGEEEYWEEEWGEEEVAFHPGEGKQASPLVEEGLFFRPEGESEQPEDGGHYHDVSGDGCGDGGYCHGVWVKHSGHGHRHGEPIGEDPREEGEIGVCLGSWAFGPEAGVLACGGEAGVRLLPTR